MRHPVVVEVGGGGEPFPADLALVGLFAGVDTPMCVERAACAEAFVTHHTHVRFFPC